METINLMKTAYKYSATLLMSVALANGSSCLESTCLAAEQTPVDLAERIRVLSAEDPGLLPIEQSRRRPSRNCWIFSGTLPPPIRRFASNLSRSALLLTAAVCVPAW